MRAPVREEFYKHRSTHIHAELSHNIWVAGLHHLLTIARSNSRSCDVRRRRSSSLLISVFISLKNSLRLVTWEKYVPYLQLDHARILCAYPVSMCSTLRRCFWISNSKITGHISINLYYFYSFHHFHFLLRFLFCSSTFSVCMNSPIPHISIWKNITI
jgi:hypothetical protein